MGEFARRLARFGRPLGDRGWVYVPYDQLTDRVGPLSLAAPRDVGIVLIENRWKAAQRPYHKQKLALILANMRHFALEQAARGVAVRYVSGNAPYADLLRPVIQQLGPLTMMRPAERELRVDLAPLVESGRLIEVAHEGWFTTPHQFEKSQKGPPWRMDAFYRQVRRDSGVLMRNGKPVGGQFSFDGDNREPWAGLPPAPDPPRFEPDEVTREVGELVHSAFAHHPGELRLEALPATAADAARLWRWALRECIEHFGPFEDAMSTRSSGIFHTRISQLLNISRLLPREVVADVLASRAPLSSIEGFVRQVIGWREFVRHVHEATDGLRVLPGAVLQAETRDAQPNFLNAREPLPPAFWGTPSGLRCLDTVVRDVWSEAYSHHITRLMILSNIATLLDVSPRELTDWFWVAYSDAYDWVVEPNVLAMGTFAVGDLMTTKPYIAGSAYIDRMSDYCDGCAFDPKKSCPITRLYWAFLARHEPTLRGNQRLFMPLNAMRKRSDAQKREDRRTFSQVTQLLRAGKPLTPDSLRDA